MFARLVQKELLHHVLDFRFIAILVTSLLLSVLSIYVGVWNYLQQLEEYNTSMEWNQGWPKRSIENNNINSLNYWGYSWDRKPEVLSPIVYGLSGKLGHVVNIQHKNVSQFESSFFSRDPIHFLFGTLDFGYIVKVVLSLCALLLTYDAVCGEKEASTLRLYNSYPVSKSSIALSKLFGSSIAVLIPFILSFLFASAVVAIFPEMGLRGENWGRIAVLMVVFSLYLMVFVAFGLWVSAFTHRRLTSFLILLGLWTIWVFIAPNLAVGAARALNPVESVYKLERQVNYARMKGMPEELKDAHKLVEERFQKRHGLKSGPEWPDSLSQELRKKWQLEISTWMSKFESEQFHRLRGFLSERRNKIKQQQRLAGLLSAISPVGAVSFTSMELARTGMTLHDRIENSLDAYLVYWQRFIQEKSSQEKPDVTDFALFAYQDRETFRDCLARNLFNILTLVLMAILGFAGAYVAILRYDVR